MFFMTYVAVIVAQQKDLAAAALKDVHANLEQAQEPIWLAPDEACEIHFNPSQDLSDAARRELAAQFKTLIKAPVDIAILASSNRRKKLLVADMDSTIIEEESLDELADQIGLRDPVAAITDRAMRGEIDFESALVERVALLQGLPLKHVEKVLRNLTFSAGARILVKTMKAHGCATALASGGFTLFTSYVARVLGFDYQRANLLEFENEALTGIITTPLVDGKVKRQALLSYCHELNLQPDDALAIGDGSNDLDMIVTAGMGIAYRGKPLLAQAADAQIMVCDLTAALFFQGYKKSDFVME